MIEVDGLKKRFGTVDALRGVSFMARDGAITGLLGPNGAGKSTCLRLLSTVFRADAGTAHIGGVDIDTDPLTVRRNIGVLPHGSGLYPHLTAVENIRYYGALHGMPKGELETRIETLIAKVDVAYLDGTFHADGEIPGRDMSAIPHPLITSSMKRFAALPPKQRGKVWFVHLNHTNPALDPEGEARKAIEAAFLATRHSVSSCRSDGRQHTHPACNSNS